jgi:hypothetical protein
LEIRAPNNRSKNRRQECSGGGVQEASKNQARFQDARNRR